MIDRLKKAAVFGAALTVAGAFALAAAFCALFGLLTLVMEEPWAAAVTALVFAAAFAAFAFTHRPPKAKRHGHDEDHGEHDNPLATVAGIAQHLPAQAMALARRHPAAAVSLGGLAAVILLRRPALMLMAATHLLGGGRRKRRPQDRLRELWPF